MRFEEGKERTKHGMERKQQNSRENKRGKIAARIL